jgi:hypothetical protein
MDIDQRRNDMRMDSPDYSAAGQIRVVRRDGIVQGSPAMDDANALCEINLNSSVETKRAAVGNLYRSLPDYSIKNANCSGLDLISPKTDNFWGRVRRWIAEDYFIVEVSTVYKAITVLNVLLTVCVLVMAYLMWYNGCAMQVVSTTSGETPSPSLKSFIHVVNDYITPALSAIVMTYATWRVFKRTTAECIGPARTARRAAVYASN